MSASITCGTCGAPLGHINSVCDICLPNFYSTPSSQPVQDMHELPEVEWRKTFFDWWVSSDRQASYDVLAEQAAYTAWMEALSSHSAVVKKLEGERDSWRRVAERCKSEAEGHAMEARTANSTIHEMYQALTGATGEPGNWNGAQPAREYVANSETTISSLTQKLDRAREALEAIADGEGYADEIARQTLAALSEPGESR